MDDSGVKLSWNDIKNYKILSHDNFVLGVETSELVAVARNFNIPFYHRAPLHSFMELRDLVAAGASEVILGAPLFFQLDKVRKNFPDIKIRATANVALPEGSLSYNEGITGLWIRPEDVNLYEKYIDTLEFYGDITQEQALFRIYAKQQKWPGQLSLLVQDLDHPAINRMIPSTLAEARIKCGQRCMENNTCHLCERILNLANPEVIHKAVEV